MDCPPGGRALGARQGPGDPGDGRLGLIMVWPGSGEWPGGGRPGTLCQDSPPGGDLLLPVQLDPLSLSQGSLVALYNGVKESPRLHQEWSDYRVHVNGNVDIDIPEVGVLFRPPSSSSFPQDMRSLSCYRATLAHKCNHSFTPNCRWGRVDHPRSANNINKQPGKEILYNISSRFGLISSLVALRQLEAGEEVGQLQLLPPALAFPSSSSFSLQP